MGFDLRMGKIITPTIQDVKRNDYDTRQFDLCSIECYLGKDCPILENNFYAYIKKNNAVDMFLWQQLTHSCIDVRAFARKNQLQYESNGFYVVPNKELEQYNQYWFIKLTKQNGELVFEELKKFDIRPIRVGVANIKNIYHYNRPPSNKSLFGGLGWRLDKKSFDQVKSVFSKTDYLQDFSSFFENIEIGKYAVRLT